MKPLRRLLIWPWLAGVAIVAWKSPPARAGESPGVTEFHKNIQPLLEHYCYECHGDGSSKGDVAFDVLKSKEEILNPDLWSKVMKNLRSRLMPPPEAPRPAAAEQKRLEDWVKYQAFAIDPKNPDPGRVTLRRLNRVEYRNTIRDLTGVDFNADTEFPPDDTGYGFDDIGDVLTVSPMLLEKYMTAATAIVDEAVPKVETVTPEVKLAGSRFRAGGANSGNRNRGGNQRDTLLGLSYYQPATVSASFNAPHDGTYRVALELSVKGAFDFDPGQCRVIFKADGKELLRQEFSWENNKTFPPFTFEEKWQTGAHRLAFELEPLTPVERKVNSLEMRINFVTIQGPTEEKYATRPKNFDRFFGKDAPKDKSGRKKYAQELLGNFAQKAFRRPVDGKTLDRLVALAASVYNEPGKTFEAGVAQAMVAVLASPRFLFLSGEAEKTSSRDPYPLVDEYSLAARLSYFLWSTMPDEELFRLAGKGELRKNLAAQVSRMLADPRSEALARDFTGQWLQARDVEGIAIDAKAVLAHDTAKEQRQARRGGKEVLPPFELDGDLRRAMERETQMVFSSIMHDDRSVLELIDSDYTFVNQKLAGFYGLTNLGVKGNEMQRVTLPPDSLRGGVLTEGTVLVVTSNPDRTSPVKRGLFVLNNILGSPPPPPPPNIPALEAAEKNIHGHEPTLRETLAVHRDKPECAACHARMDPIGLAFENFNALGSWRAKERGQTIEAGGSLPGSESFQSVRDLKHILADNHREEFYRCLTEKMLTYATGRGTEYYDTETVDQIVQRLDAANGRFSALLTGIIESAPFQKERKKANAAFSEAPEPSGKNAVRVITRNQSTP